MMGEGPLVMDESPLVMGDLVSGPVDHHSPIIAKCLYNYHNIIM